MHGDGIFLDLDCNHGSMSLCVCQNLRNWTLKRVNFTVSIKIII